MEVEVVECNNPTFWTKKRHIQDFWHMYMRLNLRQIFRAQTKQHSDQNLFN
jgi:hypothetical protein